MFFYFCKILKGRITCKTYIACIIKQLFAVYLDIYNH